MKRAERQREDRRLVPVCAVCLRASCMKGFVTCGAPKIAPLRYPVRTLRKLKKEEPHYWGAK